MKKLDRVGIVFLQYEIVTKADLETNQSVRTE